jgi:hypothetical protein
MRSRELLMALFVVVAVVAGCKDKDKDKESVPAFIIFKNSNQMYGIAVDENGTRYLIQAETIWKCDGANQHCVQQAKACPTCSVCDCRRVECTKWCLHAPVIEMAAEPIPVPPTPPGDPATQPAPTAPK